MITPKQKIFIIVNIVLLLSYTTIHIVANAESSYDMTSQSRYFYENSEHTPINTRFDTALRIHVDSTHYFSKNIDVRADITTKIADENSYVNPHVFLTNYYGENWDIRIGFDTVFWGVMELNHLVDTINQLNTRESFHGEEKLGQAMISSRYAANAYMIESFILFGTPERDFPSSNQRFSGGTALNVEQTRFEANNGSNQIDYALRFSQTIGRFDYAINFFSGTRRTPTLEPTTGLAPETENVVTAFYPKTNRVGVEWQATIENTLVKAEALYEDSESIRYFAYSTGLEHTIVSIFSSKSDLGLLVEYNFDERRDPVLNPYQNDVFLGLRLALNNQNSSEFIAGTNQDLDSGSRIWRIQYDTRLGERFAIGIDTWWLQYISNADALALIQDDSYLDFKFSYYF